MRKNLNDLRETRPTVDELLTNERSREMATLVLTRARRLRMKNLALKSAGLAVGLLIGTYVLLGGRHSRTNFIASVTTNRQPEITTSTYSDRANQLGPLAGYSHSVEIWSEIRRLQYTRECWPASVLHTMIDDVARRVAPNESIQVVVRTSQGACARVEQVQMNPLVVEIRTVGPPTT